MQSNSWNYFMNRILQYCGDDAFVKQQDAKASQQQAETMRKSDLVTALNATIQRNETERKEQIRKEQEDAREEVVFQIRRLYLFATIVAIMIALVMVLVPLSALGVYQTISLCSGCYAIMYGTALVWTVRSAKELHYIKVDCWDVAYGMEYKGFAVQSKVEHKYNECIKSIAGVTALPGSSIAKLFTICTVTQYSLYLFAIISKINEWTRNDD
eukprot:394033_1